jgi:hypothetical protein
VYTGIQGEYIINTCLRQAEIVFISKATSLLDVPIKSC